MCIGLAQHCKTGITTPPNIETVTSKPFPVSIFFIQDSGIDENYQEDGSENYHELLENLEVSSTNKEKSDNGKYDLARLPC